ncbi:GNAT family N-acetyltransferase [Shinella zoogloeoides]|uniref:GNAT family N-acetyltransferase n=1 Tax=Shinella zoogloeoides TaxID=352475 RepID=A0A6N8TPA5_SHIZO|nr:GNAT family N-acetyltransferase [Shinella zoogloeoides]MXO03078.1 hypothetical protein [Shinella zoogloeoides]UEX81899.1 hypothetical protein K8M09_00925 [Shinella zoogloeoides]
MMDTDDFDCHFRRAVSHDVEQLDRILHKAVLEIYGGFETGRPFVAQPLFSEIAIVGSEIIGVAAFSDEVLTCLYVVDRFRNSGVGTCLLHNAMLSGVRATTIPLSNVWGQAFFEHRGWSTRGEIEAKIFGAKTRVVALSFG